MALTDDLRNYIAHHSDTKTKITQKHNVAIVGEQHAPIGSGDTVAIRTNTSSRLILELLCDTRYRYFASEHFMNSGQVRVGLRKFLRDATLPPTLDPTTVNFDDPNLDMNDVAKRVLLNRHQLILDFLRRHPHYVLSIGTLIGGSARDKLLAQNFLEEMTDRKLSSGVPGVLLLGAAHAAAVWDDQPTTRMILEKHGYKCVSIRAMADFVNKDGVPDDLVVPLETPLDNITQADFIRLTSLVDKTPITIPTDKPVAADQPSPFRRVTFGLNHKSVAEQFEYLVLQKA